MPILAYAMCRRDDLAHIQRYGFNQTALVPGAPRLVTLRLFDTEEAATRMSFGVGFAKQLGQGVILYVDLEGMPYDVREDGIVHLRGIFKDAGIPAHRFGVLRLTSLVRPGNDEPKEKREVTPEESRKRSESQKRSWATRRANQALAALPTL